MDQDETPTEGAVEEAETSQAEEAVDGAGE